ncbi:MAG: crosslink repair DNA glycosylase YcaQ family protein [Acidobacteriota bacterium]
MTATLTQRQARRLALLRAGLIKPSWSGMPARGARYGRAAALKVIRRFGYLQLDTVSIAGARSHVLVLLSRLTGFDPALGERLLEPGEPLFEYWGHEASWLPLELYPAFEFRRRECARHPWWGDLIGKHQDVADGLIARIAAEGPLRSADFEEGGRRKGDRAGWWNLKVAAKVATALWSCGRLAIRRRSAFQRHYDLAERVIPEELRGRPLGREDALPILLERALAGHGWATTGTLAATWRLKSLRPAIDSALRRLTDEGRILPCRLLVGRSKADAIGWVRPQDLEFADRLGDLRPRRGRGVLLSPFDPVLWDRGRVQTLFGFEQLLEIFKPAPQRRWGYFCLPVLAGDSLIGRVDLKAENAAGRLRVLSRHFERSKPTAADRSAMDSALERHGEALSLAVADD